MCGKRILLMTFIILGLFMTAWLSAEDQSGSIGDFIQEGKFEQLQQLEWITNPELLFAEDFNDFPMFEEELYKMEHPNATLARLKPPQYLRLVTTAALVVGDTYSLTFVQRASYVWVAATGTIQTRGWTQEMWVKNINM